MDKIIAGLLILSFSISVFGDVEVKTTHGRVSGIDFKTFLEQKEYHGFMGIPFAAPPVNGLRFKDPLELEPWDGVLQAKKIRPACVQFNTNIRKGQTFGIYGEEDCLYLDIYTPAVDENKRPVIVFLYSELLKNSYNKTKDYAPDFFIEEDLVVVTVSHRLAVFGFLSFEDETVPGNAGLKDVVAALEWISNNVQNFGGDPARVTLMGASGGAATVDLLVRTKAKKYFRSAILQSGTSLDPAYLQENVRERAFELSKLLDIAILNRNTILQDLNEIPPSNLLKVELRAMPPDYFKENQRSVVTFSPIVEKGADGLITEYPENSFEDINIPILIGSNSREGLAASLRYLIEPRYLSFVEKDFPFLLPIRTKFRFDPLFETFFEAIDDIKKFYFKGKKVTYKSTSEFTNYMGDLRSYAIDRTVRLYSNVSLNSVYYYQFDYDGDLNENKKGLLKRAVVKDGVWGATTGDELCYLFVCPDLKEKYIKHKITESPEIVTQRKLIKLWANFVKYGNPTPKEANPLNVEWPPYNLETKQYLHISNDIRVGENLLGKKFKFWDNFLIKWEKRAVNGVVAEDRSDSNRRDEL